MNSIFESLNLIVEKLEELQIDYFIGGSVASSNHGRPRATMDIDIVVVLPLEKVSDFCNLVSKNFYVDEQAAIDAVNQFGSFNLLNLETMMKIDIFISKNRDFDQDQFKRRKKDTLESNEMNSPMFYFCTPEDSILAKMEWYQLSNRTSDRQRLDILGILAVNKNQNRF